MRVHSLLKHRPNLRGAENGFALAGFLIMLPLLLAVLVSVVAAFYLLKNEGESKQICRTTALSMQETVAARLNQLIKMNPAAKVLRAKRTAADQTVKATEAYPLLLPAALVAQAAVVAEQTTFAASQKLLIADAERASIFARIELKAKIHAALARAHDVQTSEASSSQLLSALNLPYLQSDISVNLPRFEVEASPKESLTPDYQAADDFSKLEALHVQWKLDVAQLLPEWIQKILALTSQSPNIKINLGCGATVVASDNENDGESDTTTTGAKDSPSSALKNAGNQLEKMGGGAGWFAKLTQDK